MTAALRTKHKTGRETTSSLLLLRATCTDTMMKSGNDGDEENLKKVWVHFVGVGGSGLSALALLALKQVLCSVCVCVLKFIYKFGQFYFTNDPFCFSLFWGRLVDSRTGQAKLTENLCLSLCADIMDFKFDVRAMRLADRILSGAATWID